MIISPAATSTSTTAPTTIGPILRRVGGICSVDKPCGVAAFLDFSKPGGKIPQKMEYLGLKIWTGLWGTLLHRNHEVYGYIAESLQRFPDRPHLRDIFRDKGFSVIDSRLFFGGVTELLMVQKLQPGEAP